MARLPPKKLLQGFIAFGSAYLLGGAILDSISNALAQINWRFTIIGTVVLACIWITIQIILKRFPTSSTAYNIRRLKYLPACALAGYLLLLWTPPILRLFNQAKTPSPAPIVNEVKASDQPKVTVLVSEFAGPNPESYGVTQIITEQLTNAVKDYSDVKIKPLRVSIDSSEAAHAKGKEERADIVLWGSYLANAAKTRVTIHFEVLDKSFDVPLKHDNQTITASTAKLESFTIQEELSKQMTYLVLLTVGVARLNALDLAGAIASFTSAISISSAPTEIIEPRHIYEYRAICYLMNGQTDEAISDFSSALGFKQQFELLNWRAMAYMYQAKVDKALQDVNKALQIGENDQSYALRGFIYRFIKDDNQRGWSDFERSLALNPANTSALSGRGTILLERHEWDLAIVEFQKIVSLNVRRSTNARAFNSLGVAYESKGDQQNARLNYSLAIEAKPDEADFYYNRGNFYAKYGYPDEAILDAEKAMTIEPSASRNYTVRGTAFLKKGQFDKAIADYTKAISLDPNGPTTYGDYYNRGEAYSKQGDYDKSIENYDQAIRLNPNHSEPWASRCNAYLNKTDFVRAVADCNQAITLDPKNSMAYNNRGAALASLMMFSRAMPDFEEAIKLNPQNSLAHFNMALAYRDQGQLDRAITELTTVIQMKRDKQVVEMAKKELCALDNARCQFGY